MTAALTVLALAGCPGDDLAAQGGETGGEIDDSVDPLDGAGALPPTGGPRQAGWDAPSTLGNGLVHDTRARVSDDAYSIEVSALDLRRGVAWASFVGTHSTIAQKGFRPAQVDADLRLIDGLRLVDRSLYISDDDANYRTDVYTHGFPSLAAERTFDDWGPAAFGARPTSVQTFVASGVVGDTIAWVYDSPLATPTRPWTLKLGLSAQELEGLLASPGWRPVSLSSRHRGGVSEYAVILTETAAPERWSASVAVTTAALAGVIHERWQAGFYPFRITTEDRRATRVNILWTARPPGISVQVRTGLSEAALADEDGFWRARGYHLETTDEYIDGGELRHAAVWVRYQPFLRWQGSAFAADDPDYLGKYAMFHDQTVRMMASMTELDCSKGQSCPAGTVCYACPEDAPCFYGGVCVEADFGAGTFPSATLHIFEGAELVLNRAYTFAPAIYRDTPINASMKTASVSKSLTAAAVIRALDEQGQTASMPLHSALKLFPRYDLRSGRGVVRVRDVLNHWGGFAAVGAQEPDSYFEHRLIGAKGFAPPIDGEDFFNYVFAAPPDGYIGVGLMNDSYWERAWVIPGMIQYSNAGYSLVGEVLRVQSGERYKDYLVHEFFAPLGLEKRVFPDSGRRTFPQDVTLAEVGGYLVDTSHPYNLGAPSPEPPAEGISDNIVADWLSYFGPVDVRAPAWATVRYAGDFYLGGAPLAAGGWWADGEALGRLIREIVQFDTIFPDDLKPWLWHPAATVFVNTPVPSWGYLHGWYVRGNWVSWMGSDAGGVAMVLHNRMYDVSVVFMANGFGSPGSFINPIMATPSPQNPQPGTSPIGQVWPCIPDPSLAPQATGCEGMVY